MKSFRNLCCAALAQVLAVLALSAPVYAAALPATGDNRPITIIIIVMAVALVAVVGMSVMGSKNKKGKKRK